MTRKEFEALIASMTDEQYDIYAWWWTKHPEATVEERQHKASWIVTNTKAEAAA